MSHGGGVWGELYSGLKLLSLPGNPREFRLPTEKEVERVAIKRLSIHRVREHLAAGRMENPLKGIERMRQLGDNHHVLELVEALQDENYLYIVMPFCEGGDLAQWRNNPDGIRERFRGFGQVFKNILENMKYLHDHDLRVCHRILSLDNCMVLGNRIVFINLAMSFRIPPTSNTNHTTQNGSYWKVPYLPPEVASPGTGYGLTPWVVNCGVWLSCCSTYFRGMQRMILDGDVLGNPI